MKIKKTLTVLCIFLVLFSSGCSNNTKTSNNSNKYKDEFISRLDYDERINRLIKSYNLDIKQFDYLRSKTDRSREKKEEYFYLYADNYQSEDLHFTLRTYLGTEYNLYDNNEQVFDGYNMYGYIDGYQQLYPDYNANDPLGVHNKSIEGIYEPLEPIYYYGNYVSDVKFDIKYLNSEDEWVYIEIIGGQIDMRDGERRVIGEDDKSYYIEYPKTFDKIGIVFYDDGRVYYRKNDSYYQLIKTS